MNIYNLYKCRLFDLENKINSLVVWNFKDAKEVPQTE